MLLEKYVGLNGLSVSLLKSILYLYIYICILYILKMIFLIYFQKRVNFRFLPYIAIHHFFVHCNQCRKWQNVLALFSIIVIRFSNISVAITFIRPFLYTFLITTNLCNFEFEIYTWHDTVVLNHPPKTNICLLNTIISSQWRSDPLQ